MESAELTYVSKPIKHSVTPSTDDKLAKSRTEGLPRAGSVTAVTKIQQHNARRQASLLHDSSTTGEHQPDDEGEPMIIRPCCGETGKEEDDEDDKNSSLHAGDCLSVAGSSMFEDDSVSKVSETLAAAAVDCTTTTSSTHTNLGETAEKTLRDLVVKTNRAEGSDLNVSRVYKKNGIQQVSLWRFKTESTSSCDQLQKHHLEEYPTRWEGKCNRCLRNFSSIPIFPPEPEEAYDGVHRVWVLEPFAHCSGCCAKAPIVEGGACNKEQRLSNLARFIREFFDPDCETIPYRPLCLVKDINPLTGKLTWEEWDNLSLRFNMMIAKPFFRFVDTSLEIREPRVRLAERNARFEKSLNTKATVQQQEEFRKRTQMILDQKRNMAPNIQDSNIGRQLGLLSQI